MNINASLFVQMVVFLLGAWVTMKYIWPPLIHAIEERQKKIADGLAAANKGEKALAVATEQGQAIEAAARARASTIVADGEKRALAIVEDARSKLTALSNLPRRKPMCRFSVRAISSATRLLIWPFRVLNRFSPARSIRLFMLSCLIN